MYSSPGVADGKVYVGSWNGSGNSGRAPFYCLNASTGAFIWSYSTNAPTIDGSPAIVDGVVYIGADDYNVYAFGLHDVAVTNVTSSKTGCLPMPTVGQGQGLNISVTAANFGNYSETFNVTIYANTTYLASQNVTLSSENSTTITFTWNTTGFAYGNYTISAYAWPVLGETNTTNNNCTGDLVKVTIPGDINGDFRANLSDLGKLAKTFNSHEANYHYKGEPASPNWNTNADINNDGMVDLPDLGILTKHYNQHYP